MNKEKFPVTPAIRLLRENNIPFTSHLYPYEEHGGTDHSARCLGVDEHGDHQNSHHGKKTHKIQLDRADARRPQGFHPGAGAAAGV